MIIICTLPANDGADAADSLKAELRTTGKPNDGELSWLNLFQPPAAQPDPAGSRQQ